MPDGATCLACEWTTMRAQIDSEFHRPTSLTYEELFDAMHLLEGTCLYRLSDGFLGSYD